MKSITTYGSKLFRGAWVMLMPVISKLAEKTQRHSSPSAVRTITLGIELKILPSFWNSYVTLQKASQSSTKTTSTLWWPHPVLGGITINIILGLEAQSRMLFGPSLLDSLKIDVTDFPLTELQWYLVTSLIKPNFAKPSTPEPKTKYLAHKRAMPLRNPKPNTSGRCTAKTVSRANIHSWEARNHRRHCHHTNVQGMECWTRVHRHSLLTRSYANKLHSIRMKTDLTRALVAANC